MPISLKFYRDQLLSTGESSSPLPAAHRLIYIRYGSVIANGATLTQDQYAYHHDPLSLQGEAELEAWAQPWRPDNVVAVHFFGDLFGILSRTNRDGRIRVRVIHVFAGHKGVQRRVDGGRARIEVKGAVRVHAYHLIFGGGLWAALFLVRVDILQRDQFLLIK